jgi:glycosyltransferase involved in cell wall biosynthesis
MPKVAHIATAYQSIITILDSKLRLFDKFNDIEITAISSSPAIDGMRCPSVRHIRVEMARSIKPSADLKSIWRLYKVLKSEKFDIVHSHTAKAGFITAVSAKMAGVPLVCHTYHGLPFFEGQATRAYWTYWFLEKVACKFRDYIFTQNTRDLPSCVKLKGDRSKVLFEGNGVDIELVRQCAQEQLPQALKDFPNKGVKLVLLNRLEPVKRVADFLTVVDKLRRKGVEVSCVVAGFGVLEKQLREQLSKMRLDDCANMVGFSSHPYGLIAASDIVVLCSEKEGIPRSIMEAMALEKPVVATDVLGTEELVTDGETGLLVPVGDTDKMAEKIKLFADDAGLRAKMGAAGLNKVKEHFNDKIVTNVLHTFYLREIEKETRSLHGVR